MLTLFQASKVPFKFKCEIVVTLFLYMLNYLLRERIPCSLKANETSISQCRQQRMGPKVKHIEETQKMDKESRDMLSLLKQVVNQRQTEASRSWFH